MDFSELIRRTDYLHVIFNHIPIECLGAGLLALALGIWFRSPQARMISLTLIIISSLSVYPVFELGESAYDRISAKIDDSGQEWLDEHSNRAEQVIYFYYLLALVAATGLFAEYKKHKSTVHVGVLTLALGTGVLIGGMWVSQAGGKIAHQEFRFGTSPK